MNETNSNVGASGRGIAVAAVFPDRERAVHAFDLLKAQGFEQPWLATTKPAQTGEPSAAKPADNVSQNEVADSSDGALGAIGRFFSGEGNSLRRSLEDHGIDPAEAADIDDHLPPEAAVITVFAQERSELAAQILREGGGRLSGSATAWDAPSEPAPGAGIPVPESAAEFAVTTSRTLVDTKPLAGVPGAYEEIFIERRVVLPPSAGGPLPLDASRETLGLADLT